MRCFTIPSILFILFLYGCAAPPSWHPTYALSLNYAKTNYTQKSLNIDLKKNNKYGTLELDVSPPGPQLIIENYNITIDDNEPIEFYKYSLLYITLDEGNHHFKIGCKGFGFDSSADISIKANENIKYNYIGPWSIYHFGDLNEIKP